MELPLCGERPGRNGRGAGSFLMEYGLPARFQLDQGSAIAQSNGGDSTAVASCIDVQTDGTGLALRPNMPLASCTHRIERLPGITPMKVATYRS
jgi:hypothetical protein